MTAPPDRRSRRTDVARRRLPATWATLIACAVVTAFPANGLSQVPAVPTTPTAPASTTPAPTAPDAPVGTTPDADVGDLVPAAPTKQLSYAARLVVPVTIRAKPAAEARAVTDLEPFGSWNGGPVVLQIAEVRTVDGERWLRVRLPIRPNGSTGWLREASVEVKALRYRITISRRLHRLTLFKDGRKVEATRVVIGAASTPTPRGTFAVLEVVRQRKGEVIGPWALHLTAHSDVLDNYGGGPGRVALHGRSGPLLKDPLGSSRSHGCIRMSNAFVAKLRSVATEGTPVVIT